MKKFWAFLAILLTFALTTELAHAKRFGGGKSFGRQYQTAPQAPSRQQAAPAPAQNTQAATAPGAPARKGGMMGGLLGGLLAGGLLAALFAGGAFDGIQIMDVLLIAVAIFGVMFLLRRLRGAPGPQPAYAGAARQMPDPAPLRRDAPAFGGSASAAPSSPAIPMNLPHGFDSPAFLAGALEHYRTLQDAWNRNDLVKIREYCSPELYDLLRVERASLPAEQHTEVLSVDVAVVRADQAFGMADISLRFTGRYRDVVEAVEADFTDIWHLERDTRQDGAPWLITGVEST